MTLKTWIKLMLISFLVSSCAGIPKPEGKVGVVHILDVNQPYINLFDMQTDFDDDLHVLPGHKGTKKNLGPGASELDKHVCMDARSYANALAAYQKLKARYEKCEVGD
ncbi:MAG TPA: hypothetical protein VEF04_07900 [Blastocatellia bacterium]|nr:hypothetical protein [Blastocatellia bacterium]